MGLRLIRSRSIRSRTCFFGRRGIHLGLRLGSRSCLGFRRCFRLWLWGRLFGRCGFLGRCLGFRLGCWLWFRLRCWLRFRLRCWLRFRLRRWLWFRFGCWLCFRLGCWLRFRLGCWLRFRLGCWLRFRLGCWLRFRLGRWLWFRLRCWLWFRLRCWLWFRLKRWFGLGFRHRLLRVGSRLFCLRGLFGGRRCSVRWQFLFGLSNPECGLIRRKG
uniref:Uncharacterized protein n=1 Tax=Fulvimarina pelagi TaxID=217511 RepID=A0A0P0ZAE7_9HYPH|nr:hypothetical protein [Fulvimarina pelagi]